MREVEPERDNEEANTIQILSIKGTLEISFAISYVWKQRRLFDSRRLQPSLRTTGRSEGCRAEALLGEGRLCALY